MSEKNGEEDDYAPSEEVVVEESVPTDEVVRITEEEDAEAPPESNSRPTEPEQPPCETLSFLLLVDWRLAEDPTKLSSSAWAVYDVAKDTVAAKFSLSTEQDLEEFLKEVETKFSSFSKIFVSEKTPEMSVQPSESDIGVLVVYSVQHLMGAPLAKENAEETDESARQKFLHMSPLFRRFIDLSTVLAFYYDIDGDQTAMSFEGTYRTVMTSNDFKLEVAEPSEDAGASLDRTISLLRKLYADHQVQMRTDMCSVTERKQDTTEDAKTPSSGASVDVKDAVLRLRGLPWQTTEKEIVDFVKQVDPQLTEAQVTIVRDHNRRHMGQALIELSSPDLVNQAVTELHGKYCGSRWAEVTAASKDDLLEQRGVTRPAVRLRGLPYEATEYTIRSFLKEHDVSVKHNDVVISYHPDGRMTGQAFVLLSTSHNAEEIQNRLHQKNMKHRYIEAFQCSAEEFHQARRQQDRNHGERGGPVRGERGDYGDRGGYPRGAHSRYTPYGEDRGHYRNNRPHAGYGRPPPHYDYRSGPPPPDPYGYASRVPPPISCQSEKRCLRMRGLPFNADERHICEFFAGFAMSAILPATVPIEGKPSGEAYVEFTGSEEARRAHESKNRGMMERRYIELFLCSQEEMKLAAEGLDPREIRRRMQLGGQTSSYY